MFDIKELEINLGPQHPATHGVLRIILRLDGEKIMHVKPVIGYLHRGAEKMMENVNYHGVVPFTDRLDYVASANNNHAYVGTIEKLMNIEVPKRAQYIRVMLAELQRISSHLVWLGTHALDIGAMTPFFYTMRERELILDLFEDFCGARLTLNCMKIGGVPEDLPDGWINKLEQFIEIFEKKIWDYENLLTDNRIWKIRTIGIGAISGEKAINFGLTGPVLRACGIRWDIRRALPYEIYNELTFDIPTGKNGDTYDRYKVRMEEMRQSVRILKQCIEKIPAGEITAKIPRMLKPKPAEVYYSVEAPKGELGFTIISDGTDKPYRVKVRSPNFVNLQSLPELSSGHLVGDLIALIGSLDVVLGDIDR